MCNDAIYNTITQVTIVALTYLTHTHTVRARLGLLHNFTLASIKDFLPGNLVYKTSVCVCVAEVCLHVFSIFVPSTKMFVSSVKRVYLHRQTVRLQHKMHLSLEVVLRDETSSI